MGALDWLVVGTILFVCYCISGLAGKHLYWLANRRRVVHGDMTGGDIVGRNRNVGTFNISGRTFRGNNITITNDRIVIDGKDVTDEYEIKPAGILEIKVLEGTIENLRTDASVSCNDVAGYVDAGGSVECRNVQGNVDAGGSVNCGTVGGDVDAGGSVKCGSVGGSIAAGGSVRHG